LARFEVLAATNMKMAVFWNIALCSQIFTDVSKELTVFIFRVKTSSFLWLSSSLPLVLPELCLVQPTYVIPQSFRTNINNRPTIWSDRAQQEDKNGSSHHTRLKSGHEPQKGLDIDTDWMAVSRNVTLNVTQRDDVLG
jgi:hypothetical protein